MNVDYLRRHATVLGYAREKGFGGLVAGEPQNVYYLTGFWGEAFAVLTGDGTSLVVPGLEFERAKEAASSVEVVGSERGANIFNKVKERLGPNRAVVDNVDAMTFNRLSSFLSGGVTVDPEALMLSRRTKDEAEQAFLVEGGKVMDRLYEVTAELLAPGTDERSVAAAAIEEMMRLKADPPAYASTLNPLIVASGPNGALPHAYTTERRMERGDFVVCDYVLRYGGYVVDATRTFAVGEVSDVMKESYDAVLRSQEAGLQAAKVGARTSDVDSACRDLLASRGLAEYFVHGTGHGVGLDVHEAPFVRKGDQEVLKENYAVTIEPGVYFKGKYGVRIEDSIIVKERPVVLTHYPKTLTSL
jgi:Xaa-Pro aminopeptidase